MKTGTTDIEYGWITGKGNLFPHQIYLEVNSKELYLPAALANNPQIIICDEPTGNLDPDTAWGIMKSFRRY